MWGVPGVPVVSPPMMEHVSPQAGHDVLHVAGVDVVSLQQAAVAGALHGELRSTDTGFSAGSNGEPAGSNGEPAALPVVSGPLQRAPRTGTAAARTRSASSS